MTFATLITATIINNNKRLGAAIYNVFYYIIYFRTFETYNSHTWKGFHFFFPFLIKRNYIRRTSYSIRKVQRKNVVAE